MPTSQKIRTRSRRGVLARTGFGLLPGRQVGYVPWDVRSLPIDPLLSDIAETVSQARSLVLEAEPGAGKTTRVPVALHRASAFADGCIVVAEPRRLAARLAAEHVARELGESVGKTVGYSVRFEQATSRETRILYVTEGVLLRRLIVDPTLAGVSAVILDEFHERHLTTDVLLALVDRLKRSQRPDLALVVMSATLDGEALALHLGAPRLRSEGRLFPVAIEHAERPDERPVDGRVTAAVRRLLDEEKDGDILVFLPGAREIRKCADALGSVVAEGKVLVLPLHGDLSIRDQARAVEPAALRKVILSTNVAESSVTIDGVTAVIDTGLARIAGHSPWSGLPTLVTAKISRASATQRAGRAGRTRAGRVLRLYSSGDLGARPAQDKPEILREDLAETFLGLHGLGVRDPRELRWLAAPPDAALIAAEALLQRLGALSADGSLTAIGNRMLAFPLAPRLSRVVVEGERRGVANEACLAVALLSERDIRATTRADFGGGRAGRGIDASGPSDVLELCERFREAEETRFDPRRLSHMGLDARSVEGVNRSYRQLTRVARDDSARPSGIEAADTALQIALVAGFPDRLARRRSRADRSLVLWSGRAARLADNSVVHDATLILALDAEQVQGATIVRLASAVLVDWLFELYPDMVEMSDQLAWNPVSDMVERVSRISAGSVVIEEERKPAPPSPEASTLLLAALRARTPPWHEADERAHRLLLRLDLIRREIPEAGLPEVGATVVEGALERVCVGRTRLSELAAVDLTEELSGELDGQQRALMDREAPERMTLPGGRVVEVHYETGKAPWIESRIQDFFGMARTPALCRGRVPLTVHLLAPNQRAVQVTNDLVGFWDRHYPGIRRELCRRYPRHPWPEDGASAAPPPPLPPRRRST